MKTETTKKRIKTKFKVSEQSGRKLLDVLGFNGVALPSLPDGWKYDGCGIWISSETGHQVKGRGTNPLEAARAAVKMAEGLKL